MSDYLEKLHKEIYEIIQRIDKVCNDNGLRYYLIGGTLLGAVRHGGFIPWDDDLDIAMPRADFQRFIAIAARELGSEYHLSWITTDPQYFLRFAKVCKNNTSFVENLGRGSYSDFGIFVDIFPLDVTNGYNKKIEYRRAISKKLEIAMHLRRENVHDIKHLLAKIVPNPVLHYISTAVMRSKSSKSGSYYSNFGSQYAIKKQTMPISWFAEGICIQFEDGEFSAPKEYQRVLESIFGPNYMQLPPKNSRRTHYPQKVVFSDGEVMLFKTPDKKVSVEDNT
ncbi:LicD family protein [uncultured Ruminococcus sp.]|uniref:LicD family protein n=1 Tax=uncultured Ruminococcus sp. TaxID=165186 RepID=UPI0025F73592|nr:LicD family protein [uncultured Ruminococcus sp.]